MMMERDEFLLENSGLATSDINYNLTLNDRTLFKEKEEWNTLCLSFSVSNFEGTPLERAIVKTFTGSDYENDHGEQELTLNFSENLSSIEAGKPYLVKWNPTYVDEWESDVDEENCENPEFKNVTISATAGSSIGSLLVDFVGTLSPLEVKANNKSLLYMGHNNKLRYTGVDMTIGSCRSYFLLGTVDEEVSNAARIVLNFGDGETTGIFEIENGKMKMENEAGALYDLQGRKVTTPTKGLYIVRSAEGRLQGKNGKKVIIK